MSKLNTKYNFLIFIFLIMTLVFCIDGVKAVDYSSESDHGSYIIYDYSYLILYDDVSNLVFKDNYIQEDVIFNLFQLFMEKSGLNYKFSDYPNVLVELWDGGVQNDFNFYFSTEDYYNIEDQVYGTNGNVIQINIDKYYKKVYFTYITPNESATNPHYSLSARVYAGSRASTSTNITGISKQLNFENYDLQFNENLFKDNLNFKQVCVPNNRYFAVSSNQYELIDNSGSEYHGVKHFSGYDFIWAPYNIKTLYTYIYDNSKENNIWILDKDETYFDLHPGYSHYFNSKSDIDGIYSLSDPGDFLNSLGYKDKYSYYGWYFHPFVVRYAASGLRQFNVFYFDKKVHALDINGNSLGELENYCFYINKNYDIFLLNEDEFGDQFGDTIIMGGENLNINTTQNVSKLDSQGLFENINIFLGKMSTPIDFVGSSVYDLYQSLPYLVKLFIFSVFGLVVIRVLIGMVVK